MMFWYGGHWAFWQAGLMWTGMIVFWGLLIWAVYALITTARKRPEDGHGGEARLIPDQRVASGEIDTAEYQRLHGLITVGDHQSPAGTGSTR